MKIANILVASDLSEHCGIAAVWAENLKRLLGGPRVVVEHTIELSVSSWLKSAFEQLEDPVTRAQAEQKVAQWYQDSAGAPPDEVVIRAGNSVTQITELNDELKDSIVVVSMTGKGAVKRFVLGSTSYALANQPPGPVVVVHDDHTGFDVSKPIVAGTDLSLNGNNVVTAAAAFARQIGAPLDIVYAYGTPESPLVNLSAPESHDAIQKKVALAIEENQALKALPHTVNVLFEEPGDALVSHAQRVGSDLIFVGHSGETPLARTVLGSVAQRVLNHMPCSIMIIPPLAAEE